MQSHVIPVNIKYLKSTVFLVDCLDLMFLFLDDLRSVFYCLFFTYKSELYPTSPTSYLNRGGSNLINSTLTDYDDVPGRGNYFYNGTPHEPHPKSTLEGFGLKEIKLNVRQLFFFLWLKLDRQASGRLGKKKNPAPSPWSRVRVSISTSTLRWWMRPQVNESDMLHLSIPLCHNESLCTGGNKTTLSDTRKCITRSNRK